MLSRCMRWRALLSILALMLASPAICPAQARFSGLGILTGNTRSEPTAISADGTTVVGVSDTRDVYNMLLGSHAWSWTAADGMVEIDLSTSGLTMARAADVSRDGSTVVGLSFGPDVDKGFVSDSAALYPSDPTSIAGTRIGGISPDGNVLVGGGFHMISSGPFTYRADHATYWTRQGTSWVASNLQGFDSDNEATAVAASNDGQIIVGRAGSEAAAWVRRVDGNYDIFGLGDAGGGGLNSMAGNITADGAFIIGNGMRSCGPEALYWARDPSGDYMIQALGDLDGGAFHSSAYGVSADGQLVAGLATSALGPQAILWSPGGSLRILQDELLHAGLAGDLAGWTLHAATDISADGKTIVGYGTNPSGQIEAWIVTVPEPASIGLLCICLLARVGRRRS